MCQRCGRQANDPRESAFQTFAMIESLSIKERDKLATGQGGYVVLVPFQDEGEAKFTSFTMMQDPELEAVKLTEVAVCLN